MATRVSFPVTPSSLEDLVVYLNEILPTIESTFGEITDGLYETQFAAPAKPKAGQVVFADGTSWNPDGVNGEGMYVYKSDAQWHYLG